MMAIQNTINTPATVDTTVMLEAESKNPGECGTSFCNNEDDNIAPGLNVAVDVITDEIFVDATVVLRMFGAFVDDFSSSVT